MNIFKLFIRKPPPIPSPVAPAPALPVVARFESVKFKMELDRKRAERHSHDLAQLFPHGVPLLLHGDDTMHVEYAFNIHYFGNVAKHLQAVRRLLQDRKVVRHVDVDVDELLHGESLIVSVLNEINAIKMYTGT